MNDQQRKGILNDRDGSPAIDGRSNPVLLYIAVWVAVPPLWLKIQAALGIQLTIIDNGVMVLDALFPIFPRSTGVPQARSESSQVRDFRYFAKSESLDLDSRSGLGGEECMGEGTDDPYMGFQNGGFTVTKKLGFGAVGAVYLFERSGSLAHRRAIKFVKKTSLREQWENEIAKVIRLRNTDGVVKYIDHGFCRVSGEEHLWIVWDYIPGQSLRALVERRSVTLPLLNDVVLRVLEVLHACHATGIQHADLHSGNIIVEDVNYEAIDGRQQRIWITDFGYCTASCGKELLDDFLGLSRIIRDCLAVIDFHTLDGRQKSVYRILKESFPKYLSESNSTEGEFSRTPSGLLRKFKELLHEQERTKKQGRQRISDYLAAELIGERFDEWKALFVPEFVGDSTLLDRNICVLTGLRGCGKTMIFRRLTALYDLHLGPSRVPGADSFVGFYVNARVIAEAFPWLPESSEADARNQVIHYFHCCWILEVLAWLKTLEVKTGQTDSYDWLVDFFKDRFGDDLTITKSNSLIEHLLAFFEREQERTRLQSAYHRTSFQLADIGFLDKFAAALEEGVRDEINGRPLYLFLDDYSLPLVNEPTQRILNAIVFKRSSQVYFKVATESVESFEPVGLNGKQLEEGDDYSLIDSGTVSLLRDREENQRIIEAIIAPRIEREPLFKGRRLTLCHILGESRMTNNSLAEKLRSGQQVSYFGREALGRMWSSNVREIISLFAELVGSERKERLRLQPNSASAIGLVSAETQNKVLRDAGGKFISLLTAATNPSSKLYEVTSGDRSFGEHLVNIAVAFQRIASYELMNKRSKNGQNYPPKQARRIEILDPQTDGCDQEIIDLYRGIIRYGLFVRDFRGKSVRGQIVPRLVIRGVLVPHCTITFSLRDSITMSWPGFCGFLRNPSEFAAKWIANHGGETMQSGNDDPAQSFLWEP